MNKKIFTLLASSLMLFLTAIAVNAQVAGFYGPDVVNLPDGMGKGAYHLRVTSIGSNFVAAGVTSPTAAASPNWQDYLLALDSAGYLKLVDDAYIQKTYHDLREALWCINIEKKEDQGIQPVYNFINKAYQSLLSVDTGRWTQNTLIPTSSYWSSVFPTAGGHTIWPQWTGNMSQVFIGGQFGNWAFSYPYNTTPLLKNQPLLIEIPDEPDYFMTFATKLNPGWSPQHDKVELVKVHWNDVKPGATGNFAEYSILKFTITDAAPRVLTEVDFNSTLWTNYPDGEYAKLIFDPDVKGAGIKNVFAQNLTAFESENNTAPYLPFNANYYLSFRKPADNGTWVYVSDGDDMDNYYNVNNILYPILRDDGEGNDDNDAPEALVNYGQFDFRLVYYPSEDSVIMNVRKFEHIEKSYGNTPSLFGGPFNGWAEDSETYTSSDGLFNWEIWNYLTVTMQDLTKALDERVLTISKEPANTRIHFGIKDCDISDDRTTVPRDLYVIRDQLGRYLVMPLETGDFIPQWLEPRSDEDPMKTPSYQWLVYPMNENAPISSVVLTNREFNWVQIEFSTVYKTPHWFNGTYNKLLYVPPTTRVIDYDNVFGWNSAAGRIGSNAYIYYSSAETHDPYINDPVLNPGNRNHWKWNITEGWHGSFLKVQDDQTVSAKKTAELDLTQDEMQKLYRTSPYLGYKYIAEDTLSYFAYSFNHLHGYDMDRYLGPKTDTLLYGIKGQNHFELILPASRRDIHGMEAYGIGWEDNLLKHPATQDIAKLKRYYYHLKENNYWDFLNNEKFVVLSENSRYALTTEAIANTRPIEKSAFYFRFTYQPPGKPEYYTLLERVQKSTAEYMAEFMNFSFSQKLKVWDETHGGSLSSADTVGIVALYIDENTAYARANAQVGRDLYSTFAISNMAEPLYRRFNEGVYFFHGMNDSKADDGGVAANDDPRLAKIYRAYNEPRVEYLYEDAHSVNARDYYTKDSRGINYLSLEDIYYHKQQVDGEVNHFPHNFAFYLDTAYVNRGTGHIKPQYMIVVGPELINEHDCFSCGAPLDLRKGIWGRYLINATDSARGRNADGTTPFNKVRDEDYIWEATWERLAFVPAIHIGDSLYILRGWHDRDYKEYFRNTTPKILRLDEYEEEYLHLESLIAEAKKANSLIDIHALDNNLHKDFVFSMRFYERYDYEHFLIESETTNRVTTGTNAGRMIAPMTGGWVKWEDQEMVITRGSYIDYIKQAEKWNTEPTTDDPVAIDEVAGTAVQVIAGEGIVTILNASGKSVTISNILGQTVAGAVLTSDNATLAAPNGVLVVAVEGESAVKAVVK